jgi:hypothetical protein
MGNNSNLQQNEFMEKIDAHKLLRVIRGKGYVVRRCDCEKVEFDMERGCARDWGKYWRSAFMVESVTEAMILKR